MPLGVRKIVAVIVALCAVTGFTMGFLSVPEKSHLPGEGLPGATAPQIDAMDAKPLAPEAPQAVVKPPVETAKKDDADKTDAPDPLEAVADASKLTAPAATPAAPEKAAAKPGTRTTGVSGAEDKVGDLLDGITPPPSDDPPH